MSTAEQKPGVGGMMLLINRKRELEGRVRSLEISRATVESRRSGLGIKTGEARTNLEYFIRSHANGDESRTPPGRIPELNRLKEDFTLKKRASDEAGEELKRIEVEITKLKDQLEGLTFGADLADVLAFEESLANARANVSDLQARLQAERNNIEVAKASVPTPDIKLRNRREDLLAEIAVGNATEADLKEVDKLVAAENAAISDAKAKAAEPIQRAEQTIAGLERKLGQAQGEMDKLLLSRSDLLHRFLHGQAETIYEEYKALAVDLYQRFERLIAIDELMKRHSPNHHNTTILGPKHFFNVPVFAVDGAPRMTDSSAIRSYQDFRLDKALAEEKERLRTLGIDWE